MKFTGVLGGCFTLFAILFATGFVGVNVWIVECTPREAETLLKLARIVAERELKRSGHVPDIETTLRAERQPAVDRTLNRYRLTTRQTNTGYEVSVEPRNWGFCRPTYNHIPVTRFPVR
jgi:hypothetical protein